MVGVWTQWRQFPDARQSGVVEAPIGPGVYEVRAVSTGRLVAFGHSRTVARDLARLQPNASPLPVWLRRWTTNVVSHSPDDLEYRTCPADTIGDARSLARGLRGRRDVFVRRRGLAGAS
jgi:hypothetical protein